MDMEKQIPPLEEISTSAFVLGENTLYEWDIAPFQETDLTLPMVDVLALLSQHPFLTARVLYRCVKDLTEDMLATLCRSGYLSSFRLCDKKDSSKVRLCLYVASHPEDVFSDGEEVLYPMDVLLRMPEGRILEHGLLSEWCVLLQNAYGKDIDVGIVEETEHAFFLACVKKDVSVKKRRGYRHSSCSFYIATRRKDGYPSKTFLSHLLSLAREHVQEEHTYFLLLCESEGDMQDHAMCIRDLSMECGEPYLATMFLYAMEEDCLLEPGPLKYCNLYYEKDDAVIRQQVAFR